MSSTEKLPEKRDVARALLLKGTVFVHLDPRIDGVMIPKWLANQPQLVLQIGLDMPVPIPDLRVDESGVFATLSFSRSPFPCSVPWNAIFALVGEDGKGIVWPESLPPEIRAEVEREAGLRDRPRSVDEPSPRVDAEAEGEDAPVLRLSDRRRPMRALRKPARAGESEPAPAADGPQASDTLPPAGAPNEAASPVAEEPTTDGPKGEGRKKPLPPYLRVVK